MLNPFILAHNSSANDGFLYLQLYENSSRSVYNVFHELGTLNVVALSGKKTCPKPAKKPSAKRASKAVKSEQAEDKPEDVLRERTFTLKTADEAMRKALELIRDKYVENSRVLLPLRWTKDAYFKHLSELRTKPAVHFSERHLLFSLLNTQPTLNAIFRSIAEMEGNEVLSDDILFSTVERYFGNGVIEDICGFRSTHQEQICGRIVCVFEDKVSYFVQDIGQGHQFIKTGKLNLSTACSADKLNHLMAFVCKEGVFYREGKQLLTVDPNDKLFSLPRTEWLSYAKEGRFYLYGQEDDLPEGTSAKTELTMPEEQPNQLTLRTISFKRPTDCEEKAKESLLEHVDKAFSAIAKDKEVRDYYAQPKLDGNRVCAFIEVIGGKAVVEYFSRSGQKRTRKYNSAYDKSLLHLYTLVNSSLQEVDDEGQRRYPPVVDNPRLMFDCECYKHGWILQKITGACNRHEDDAEFRELNLHVLSLALIDQNELTFEHIFTCLNGITNDQLRTFPNLVINRGRKVRMITEVSRFMTEAVDGGYEGTVLYPLNEGYTFGRKRLIKVKNLRDHECYPYGYEPSDADPTVIGSVKVRCRRNFDESQDYIEVCVSAALRDDIKDNSMNNPWFNKAFGWPFTIVCDNFSAEGKPLRSRFKDSFVPDCHRTDIQPAPEFEDLRKNNS